MSGFLDNFVLMGMIREKIGWLNQRNRVVAENVANADTPRYQSRDLRALDFRETLRRQSHRLALVQTSPAHMAGSKSTGTHSVRSDRAPYETAPNGNTVNLEEQFQKISEIQQDHQVSVNVMRKYLQLYRSALGLSGR